MIRLRFVIPLLFFALTTACEYLPDEVVSGACWYEGERFTHVLDADQKEVAVKPFRIQDEAGNVGHICVIEREDANPYDATTKRAATGTAFMLVESLSRIRVLYTRRSTDLCRRRSSLLCTAGDHHDMAMMTWRIWVGSGTRTYKRGMFLPSIMSEPHGRN